MTPSVPQRYSRGHRFLIRPYPRERTAGWAHSHPKPHLHLATLPYADKSRPAEDTVLLLNHETVHVVLDSIGENRASRAFDKRSNRRFTEEVEASDFVSYEPLPPLAWTICPGRAEGDLP